MHLRRIAAICRVLLTNQTLSQLRRENRTRAEFGRWVLALTTTAVGDEECGSARGTNCSGDGDLQGVVEIVSKDPTWRT